MIRFVKLKMTQTKEGDVYTLRAYENDDLRELREAPIGTEYDAVLAAVDGDGNSQLSLVVDNAPSAPEISEAS